MNLKGFQLRQNVYGMVWTHQNSVFELFDSHVRSLEEEIQNSSSHKIAKLHIL